MPGLNCHGSAGWICGWSRIVIWDFGDAIRWTIIWWYGGLCLRNLVTSDNWRHFEAVRTWAGPTFLEQFFFVNMNRKSRSWRPNCFKHLKRLHKNALHPMCSLFTLAMNFSLCIQGFLKIRVSSPMYPHYISPWYPIRSQLHNHYIQIIITSPSTFFGWLHIWRVPIVSSLFSIT